MSMKLRLRLVPSFQQYVAREFRLPTGSKAIRQQR